MLNVCSDCFDCIGSNDSYVVIGLGREKFQTSIQERTVNPEWQEECDL